MSDLHNKPSTDPDYASYQEGINDAFLQGTINDEDISNIGLIRYGDEYFGTRGAAELLKDLNTSDPSYEDMLTEINDNVKNKGVDESTVLDAGWRKSLLLSGTENSFTAVYSMTSYGLTNRPPRNPPLIIDPWMEENFYRTEVPNWGNSYPEGTTFTTYTGQKTDTVNGEPKETSYELVVVKTPWGTEAIVDALYTTTDSNGQTNALGGMTRINAITPDTPIGAFGESTQTSSTNISGGWGIVTGAHTALAFRGSFVQWNEANLTSTVDYFP
jgi:hypothetical protein